MTHLHNSTREIDNAATSSGEDKLFFWPGRSKLEFHMMVDQTQLVVVECSGDVPEYHLDTGFSTFCNRQNPVRIILCCPTTKNAHKGMFPHSTTSGCQKCCIALCIKVFINHFDQMKASPEWLNIRIYSSKHCVDRLRRALRRKV